MASQFLLLGQHIQGVLNNIIDAVNGKAPASHNHDDRYYTETETNNLLNTKVAVAGSTMTGNINWAQTDRGLTWAFNTDGAYIKFYNTGDADTNSRLEFGTSDNGNEFFRWTIAGTEEATLKSDGLRVSDSIWMGGNLVATQSWVASQNYLTAIPDEYLTQAEGDALYQPVGSYAAASHTHTFASITSKPTTLAGYGITDAASSSHTHTFASLTSKPTTLSGYGITDAATAAQGTKADTAYGWGNHASAGYLTSVSNISGYSNTLLREDNRTISPSELSAGQMRFGFTSWGNNNTSPWADFIHLRSYTDSSGGSDNLVMFKKSGLGMRIWQQAWGSATAYSSFVDVWTSGDFTSTNVSNWNTAYSWGNHAGLYAAASHTHTIEEVVGLLDKFDTKADVNHTHNYLPLSGGTITGNLTLNSATPEILFNGTSDAGVDMAIKATPEGLDFYEPEDTNKIHFRIYDDTGVDAPFGYWVNGTQIITSARVLQNVSGNISMFTNNSGYITSSALSGYATTGYVDDAVAAIVDTAPDALNTLNELARALGEDPNFATTVSTNIGTKVSKTGDTMTGALTLPNAVFTNDASSRVMYLRGTGNIIQFQDASSVNKWEVVGRQGEFYIYKNDGTGSGYRYKIDSNGNHTITGEVSVSSGFTASGNISAANFSGSSSGTNTGDQTTITGNAGSATVLQTARTINGTSFNGSANITTANWGTARTITIGGTGKSVNGSANVSWSLAEIGALGATAKAADSELLDGHDISEILPLQYGSDFANGTLVITSIDASQTNGSSFVMEVTGKGYGERTINFQVEGYIYNNTFINYDGIDYGGWFLSEVKILEYGGFLCFWWARQAYWQSFSVFVRNADSSDRKNKVTSISNSTEPTSTKKVTVTLAKVWNSTNDGASSGLDADLLDGNHASAFYLASNPSGYTTNTGTVTSVAGTGGYGGLTLSGTVTTSGNITLGGTPTGTWPISVSGNAATATSATTATSAATWTTARTITIGNTGKSVNGGANVSWTLAEIGAAAASHTHDGYLSKDGGTLTGTLTTVDVLPSEDRVYNLGGDVNRWRVVYCETLDSAGLHETNLATDDIASLPTGTVLVWKDGVNKPCSEFASHMRMGIAVFGNSSPLVQGAEPVLCTGDVSEGDYLVTSEELGHAVAVSRDFVLQHQLFDCVLGKALESGSGVSHLVKTWVNI